MTVRVRSWVAGGVALAIAAVLTPATSATAGHRSDGDTLSGRDAVVAAPLDRKRKKQARPGKPGMVSAVAAGMGTITLDWKKAPRAKRHLVRIATNVNLTDLREYAWTDRSKITVTGLTPGKDYCFQVKGKNGAGFGKPANRACRTAIRAQGLAEGPTYRFLTYNVCSNVCPDWSSRKVDAGNLIAANDPDIVGLQELKTDHGLVKEIGDGYEEAVIYKSRSIVYRASRFDVIKTGTVDLPDDRYGVWALLQDTQDYDRRIMVANTHLEPGDESALDGRRQTQASRFIEAVQRANYDDDPLVFLGDYNSHKGRAFDAPAREFADIGYYTSFDQAQTSVRPNFNSGNQGSLTPKIGTLWGAHLDHVWVDPSSTRVLRWENAARMDGGKYAAPLPSNHNPVLVVVQVN